MQMYVVVDFGCNRGGDTGTLHLIDEACPKQAPGRIEHPGCSAQTFPITAHVAFGALNDLHMVASDDICQKRWRRGFTFGQKHGSNVEFTGKQPVEQFTAKFAQPPWSPASSGAAASLSGRVTQHPIQPPAFAVAGL